MTAPVSDAMFDAAFADQFATLLRWRRDVRHFRKGPVPEADMHALLATLSCAPSVGNSQPWRIVRCRSAALRETLAAHVDAASAAFAATLADPDRARAYARLKLHGLREAGEILAVFNDEAPASGHGLGRATMPETLRYSTVMAIHTLWLAAGTRGLGLGWVSILDPAPVAALLDVPGHWHLIALLCLGYPVTATTTPELEAQGWQAREPLADRIVVR